MEHRGPDDEGTLVEPGVALGMRRLSIIDLSSGHQPIHNEDRTVWIVFNGELYNYPTLREELLKLGHSFYTHSDTEVLVHGYEQWGDGFVEKLNGMFAFAIWDKRKRRILIARDRTGIKPLYYTSAGRRACLGLGTQSAACRGPIRSERSTWFLSSSTWRSSTFRLPTIMKGVNKLPAGCTLSFDETGLQVKSYWNPDLSGQRAPQRAVVRCLQGRVPRAPAGSRAT